MGRTTPIRYRPRSAWRRMPSPKFKEYVRAKTYNFGENVHFDSAAEILGLHGPSDDEQGEQQLPRVITPEMSKKLDKSHDFLALLREANDLKKDDKPTEAMSDAEQAKKLFPPYVDDGNPYELLA